MSDYHASVLLKEALEFLNIQKNGKYIDATLGGGGHSFEMLKRGGIVLGIDQDQDAIDYVKNQSAGWRTKIKNPERLILVKGNFKDIDEIARLNGFQNTKGILFDLGVSSFQLENRRRGFSIEGGDSKLDMRMDRGIRVNAADLINGLTKKELYELFTKLGEERRASAIAEKIVEYRRISPIQTSAQLISILQDAYRIKGKISAFTKASISKRVFQALRIAVNDELNNLKESLPRALSLLEDKGRIVVISFHSLEDRIVKQTFEEFALERRGIILIQKPVTPSFAEIKLNIRSRSAKLRVFEKSI